MLLLVLLLGLAQTGTSGSEAVTITAVGDNSFSISCTGAGGTRSASVTVEGYRETDGVVVDGYISGAEVCIDEDESWTCDSNENQLLRITKVNLLLVMPTVIWYQLVEPI